MKFSGKMCLMIILKVTKKQGFTLSLEDTLFEKPQREEFKLNPPNPFPKRATSENFSQSNIICLNLFLTRLNAVRVDTVLQKCCVRRHLFLRFI